MNLQTVKNSGLVIFLMGIVLFVALPFIGSYKLTENTIQAVYGAENTSHSDSVVNYLIRSAKEKGVLDVSLNQFVFTSNFSEVISKSNNVDKSYLVQDNRYEQFRIARASAEGAVVNNQWLFFLLTIGLGIIGGLLYILPDFKLLGRPGIKNNGIFHSSINSRGVIGITLAAFLVLFYILIYWFPEYVVNWTLIVDPISFSLSGNPASEWFLYGFLYSVIMTVMAVKMIVKYRHNRYQMIRTFSVLFFQLAFAFLIPEILVRLNYPYYDFKNSFPLDYDFLWNGYGLFNYIDGGGFTINGGKLGVFMVFWGLILAVIIVPVLVYFYGKRWYCSWVCGCGGLAETMGDPFRQLSSKTLFSWKVERWLIYSVLVFVTLMTALTVVTMFSGNWNPFGIPTYTIQSTYGFLIGSVFAGVIGTGMYPILGNRTWCRFGCPMAAYMGIIQRFKSRFRITTNGGQCISCGNCSTYCEQGIDVRWYAQRGQNIVRSSCVGCGVCSAVCPRGVLKLENGPNDGKTRSELPEVIPGNKGLEDYLKGR